MENYKLTVENGIITNIDYLNVTNNSIDASIPEYEEIEACLLIPKDVVGFSDDPEFRESLIGFDPLAIEVEDGNEVFEAKNDCLIRKADKTMIMGCRNSSIPKDGSVEHIGPLVLCEPINPEEIGFNDFRIPEGIKTIGYRAFANRTDDDIYITVPDSVERVESMAFMMHPGKGSSCEIIFYGSPQLETGVFGTKAELADCDNKFLAEMPDILYSGPEFLTVKGLKNSSVEAYCRKYGIQFEVIEWYYENLINAIFGGGISKIDFSDEFYNALDEVLSQLRPNERKILKDVYLKGAVSLVLRKLRNPKRSKLLRPFFEYDEE